jgi:hypothetical protein
MNLLAALGKVINCLRRAGVLCSQHFFRTIVIEKVYGLIFLILAFVPYCQ